MEVAEQKLLKATTQGRMIGVIDRGGGGGKPDQCHQIEGEPTRGNGMIIAGIWHSGKGQNGVGLDQQKAMQFGQAQDAQVQLIEEPSRVGDLELGQH